MFNKTTKIAVKSFIAATLLCGAANIAMADNSLEGKTIVKVRAQLAFSQSKQKYSPALGATTGLSSSGKLLKTGFGGEVSATYFFTDNVAAEVGVGLQAFKLKKTLTSDGTQYSDSGVTNKSKNKRAWFIPVTATAQYHFMPDEQFSPYFGAGYYYAFAQGSSGVAKLTNTHGPVLQAGLDVWDDDLGFNLDVKKMWGKTTAKYKYMSPAVKSKTKIDPVVVSAGLGMRF